MFNLENGLDWQQQELQEETEALAKAQKKKENDLQKELKARKADDRARGIKHIAQLEASSELEDEAEEQYIQASTANGYRRGEQKASRAILSVDSLLTSEDSGSEFQEKDGENEGVETSDEGEVVDSDVDSGVIQRKVRDCWHTHSICIDHRHGIRERARARRRSARLSSASRFATR